MGITVHLSLLKLRRETKEKRGETKKNYEYENGREVGSLFPAILFLNLHCFVLKYPERESFLEAYYNYRGISIVNVYINIC